jgi:hypothetical protein
VIVRAGIGIAASVLLLGFAWTWLWGGYSDTWCIEKYENLPEGSAFHSEVGLWPPGGKCVYELPSGDVTRRAGPVPWFEWFFLAVFGLVVGGLAWLIAATGRRLPSRRP